MSWPAVEGQYTLAIDTPAGEPAIALCDQGAGNQRFDAPQGTISGEISPEVSLTCQWYRLTPSTAPPQTPEPVPTPDQQPTATGGLSGRFDIGGRSLYLTCIGEGSPTVFLESGGPGGFSDRWSAIQSQLATTTRVCSYDRAGLGQSDPAPAGLRTIQDTVNDLRALLNVVPLGCPCVFAGESWGGNIVRLFVGQFPTDVAGVILVDPVPPGFVDKFTALVGPDEPGYNSLLGPDNSEFMDQANSFRLSDTVAPPTAPTVVITHGLFLGFPLNFPVDQLETIWRDSQNEYARSAHARLVIAETSGNSVVGDQPEVVTAAIGQVVSVVRDPASLQTDLVVHRLNAEGQAISGACFQIYADAGGGARGDFRGGACDPDIDASDDGVVHFPPMAPGNYVLQEVRSPADVAVAPDTPVSVLGLATDIDIATASNSTTPTPTP